MNEIKNHVWADHELEKKCCEDANVDSEQQTLQIIAFVSFTYFKVKNGTQAM